MGDKMFEAVPITKNNHSVLIELDTTPQKRYNRHITTPVQEAIPQKAPKQKPIPHIDYEEEFSKMYESLSLGNSSVQAKHKELGKFPFNVKNVTEKLKLVKDVEEENNEIYSGFLYLVY